MVFIRAFILLFFSVVCYQLEGFSQFRENKGQWPDQVLYKAGNAERAIWIEKEGVTFDFLHPLDVGKAHEWHHNKDSTGTFRRHVFRLRFVNNSFAGEMEKEGESAYYTNHFIGNEPEHWASYVRDYETVTLKNMWPGVDVRFVQGQNLLKYDFVVNAGGDATNILWTYEGADRVELNEKRIAIETSVGVFWEQVPRAWSHFYPEASIDIGYQEKSEGFAFDISAQSNLTIDPELIVATFVGAGYGSNSNAPQESIGCGSDFHVSGDFFGSSTPANTNYPTTIGAIITIAPWSWNVGFTKFSSLGNELLWSTYLGSNSADIVLGHCVSETGIVTIASSSQNSPSICTSSCFPMTVPPMVSETPQGNDYLYLTRLNESGSSIISSVLMGEVKNVTTPIPSSVSICSASNGDIVGLLTTTGNFPSTQGAFDTQFNGTECTAIFRIKEDFSELVWSTFYGGSTSVGTGITQGFDVKILPDDRILFAGRSYGSIAVTTPDSYLPNPGILSGSNGFVGILAADGSQLEHATHLSFPDNGNSPSAPSTEIIRFVDVDHEGNVWVFGMSNNNSSEIPCSEGAYCISNGANFIAKFSSDLSELLLVSRIGSPEGQRMIPSAFMIDNCGYIYISGSCGFYDCLYGPLELTEDAISQNGGFYLAVFEPNMFELHYATKMGGNHHDTANSRFDKKGVVYQAVCIPPTNPAEPGYFNTYFEATPGAWSETQGIPFELAVFKIDFQSPATTAIMTAQLLPSEGCYPVQVQTNNYSTAGQYTWLANGTEVVPDSSGVIQLFEGGEVELMLAVYNAESCNMADTAKVTLQIPLYPTLQAAWTVDEADPCAQGGTAVSAQWTGQNATSLTWDSWAGTSNADAFAATVTEAGDYALSLTATDSICGTSETLTYDFSYHPFVFAATGAASDSCALPVTFAGQFAGAGTDQVLWQWGAESVEGVDFEQTFAEQGIYTVSVTATNEQCNQTASESWTFTAWGTMEASVVPPAETVYCVGESVALSGQTNTGTAQWTTPEGTVNSPAFNFQPSTEGTFDLTFTASDPAACSGFFEETITLTFVEPPEAAFTLLSESVPCEDNAEVQLIFTGNNAAELLWDMGDGAAYSDSAFVHTYTESGNYTIELTAFNPPCQPATAMQSVEILFGPSSASGTYHEVNIITPNGDGVNDCLRFFDEDLVDADFTVFELKVFNRWGTLVFSGSSPANHWCAKDAETGTYFYALRYGLVCGNEAGETEKTGAVTVVR